MLTQWWPHRTRTFSIILLSITCISAFIYSRKYYCISYVRTVATLGGGALGPCPHKIPKKKKRAPVVDENSYLRSIVIDLEYYIRKWAVKQKKKSHKLDFYALPSPPPPPNEMLEPSRSYTAYISVFYGRLYNTEVFLSNFYKS